MSNSTLTVDVAKLRRNITIFKASTKAQLLVVVKANAYGHGLAHVARIVAEEGAAVLGVINTDEARVIREAGIKTDIFLMGVVDNNDFAEVVELDAHVPVWRLDQLPALEKAATAAGCIGKYQIKIDTGMGRLGMFAHEIENFVAQAKNFENLKCTGIYSHFLGSDLADISGSMEQLRLFDAAVVQVRASGLNPDFVHIANSPATIRFPQTHYNLVRLGIAAYGLPPDMETSPLPTGVEAVATWSSKLLNIKKLPAGHGISYGSEYRTTETQAVGVVPVGYADGFHRHPSRVNSVLIRGQQVPVLGRVCMDHIMIDLSQVPDAAVGDKIILMGNSGDAHISADDLAVRWGTNSYDVVANIGQRVRREYI